MACACPGRPHACTTLQRHRNLPALLVHCSVSARGCFVRCCVLDPQRECTIALPRRSLGQHLCLCCTSHPDWTVQVHSLVRQLPETTAPPQRSSISPLYHICSSIQGCPAPLPIHLRQPACTIAPPRPNPFPPLYRARASPQAYIARARCASRALAHGSAVVTDARPPRPTQPLVCDTLGTCRHAQTQDSLASIPCRSFDRMQHPASSSSSRQIRQGWTGSASSLCCGDRWWWCSCPSSSPTCRGRPTPSSTPGGQCRVRPVLSALPSAWPAARHTPSCGPLASSCFSGTPCRSNTPQRSRSTPRTHPVRRNPHTAALHPLPPTRWHARPL
jgi:hypothetical protein